MRLRGRFTLWFVVAALVPIAAATALTRQVVVENYREAFERRAEFANQAVEGVLRRLEGSVEARVAALSDPDSRFVGGILQLRRTYGDIPAHELTNLRMREAPAAMAFAQLDVLFLVDADETVLLAPHYRGSQDQEAEPPRSPLAERLGGRAFYALEPIGAERPDSFLVVEAAGVARHLDHQVTVVGGVALGPELFEAVRRPGESDARVVGADGRVYVPPAGAWPDESSSRRFRMPLGGAGGEPIAYLEVALLASDLGALLERVTLLAAGLATAALLLVILLGYLVVRGITRHLDELVAGAQAAARGDLDHKVPVETRDEVGEVARAFNAMMQDLKESKERLVMAERVAAWQEIARRLAHEIKNPLTPIQMAVETARRTYRKKHPSFDEIFEESTQTVLEEAARLKRIVSEFSEFARLPKPEKRRADLNEIIASALALYQGSVAVERDLGELPELDLDRDSMTQVILNLLENARDAIGDRPDAAEGAAPGRIRVESRVTRGGSAALLVVEDNGRGIRPEDKEKLFTPYFTTKHEKGGSGLGLAIVHRIVSDHGGRISASSADGGGARFTIELPIPGASDEDLSASGSGRLPRAQGR